VPPSAPSFCARAGLACEAISLDPKSADALLRRAKAWNKKGEYDKAIADYSEVIRLAPQDPDAFSSRSHALNSKGEHAKAVADFDQATKLILVV